MIKSLKLKTERMGARTDKFYNRFSLLYPVVDLFLKPQKRRLAREINQLPHGQLLEIGVGNGSHFLFYKTHKIVGIDTSSTMLKKARIHKKDNITLLQMSGEHLEFADGSFDYIVLSHLIAVVANPERLIEEAYRVLKPQGQIFILNHFTPDNFLKYIDYFFNHFSGLFHFKSRFYIADVETIRKFQLLKEISFGRFSYFKLLIYRKK